MLDFIKTYFKKTPRDYPVFWQEYLSYFDEKIKPRTAFRECRFVVFDTETTGLDTKADRICQIGAVAVTDNTVLLKDFFDTLVIQQTGGTGEVKAVHGLRDKDLHHGMDEREAVEAFVKYLKNSIIVAHHAAFDIGMINESLKRYFGSGLKLKNKFLDTAYLERRLKPVSTYAVENPADYSLDALSGKYGIEMHDRHTAIGDAFITAQLFFKLTARLEKRGVKTIGDLLR